MSISPFEAKLIERDELRKQIRELQLDIEGNRDWWLGSRFKNMQQFAEWRQQAIGNLQYKQRKMARINLEIREARRAAQLGRVNPRVDPRDPNSLLSLAYLTLREFARKHPDEISETQQSAIDIIAAYLGDR